MTTSATLGHALAALLTVGGLPSLYYGDEQGFKGVKEEREGGDDAIRPAFPEHPGDLAATGRATYRLHQRLIGLRRRHPWLVRARTTVRHLTNTTAAIEASDGAGHRLVTLLNLGDRPHRFPLGETDLVPADASARTADPFLVPAHRWAVLRQAS